MRYRKTFVCQPGLGQDQYNRATGCLKENVKRLTSLGLCGMLALMVLPSLVLAQSAFNGTWKIDLQSAKTSGKPHVVLLKDGEYWCKSCDPAYHIKADGEFHEIPGDSKTDTYTEAITVVDDHTVRYMKKKNGKDNGTSTAIASQDGKTTTMKFSGEQNGHPIKGEFTAVRVGKQPAGSHAISGSWQIQRIGQVSDNMRTSTYKINGKMIDFSTPTGVSYHAKLGGEYVPVKGGDSGETVSLSTPGPNKLRVIYKKKDKIVSVGTYTMASDGKTMKLESKNMKTGNMFSATFVKQ